MPTTNDQSAKIAGVVKALGWMGDPDKESVFSGMDVLLNVYAQMVLQNLEIPIALEPVQAIMDAMTAAGAATVESLAELYRSRN